MASDGNAPDRERVPPPSSGTPARMSRTLVKERLSKHVVAGHQLVPLGAVRLSTKAQAESDAGMQEWRSRIVPKK